MAEEKKCMMIDRPRARPKDIQQMKSDEQAFEDKCLTILIDLQIY